MAKQPLNPATEKIRRSGCWLAFKVLVFAVVLLALAGCAAGFVAFMIYQHVTQPGIAGEPVRITVPEGAIGRDVAQILADNGLVEHEAFFRLAIRLDRSNKTIKHGGYSLPLGLSPLELLELLQEGPNRAMDAAAIPTERKVTIPEGLTIAQAAELFDDPAAFIRAASDPTLVARVGVTAPSLEGFLMPETYFFDEKPTERDVVDRMVAQFEKEYAALKAEFPEPEGFDTMGVITVASLVEEEARIPEERPDVAAVVYNRLKKRMPLQLDCTLQFALGKYGQRLLYEDRNVDSPYNTYRNAGLPPGPISSPGRAAIRAALQPANVEYLYFVSNADGKTHTFSATEAEHLRAVQRFRREISGQRRDLSREQSDNGAAER